MRVEGFATVVGRVVRRSGLLSGLLVRDDKLGKEFGVYLGFTKIERQALSKPRSKYLGFSIRYSAIVTAKGVMSHASFLGGNELLLRIKYK